MKANLINKIALKCLHLNRSDYSKAYINIESELLNIYYEGFEDGKKQQKKIIINHINKI